MVKNAIRLINRIIDETPTCTAKPYKFHKISINMVHPVFTSFESWREFHVIGKELNLKSSEFKSRKTFKSVLCSFLIFFLNTFILKFKNGNLYSFHYEWVKKNYERLYSTFSIYGRSLRSRVGKTRVFQEKDMGNWVFGFFLFIFGFFWFFPGFWVFLIPCILGLTK